MRLHQCAWCRRLKDQRGQPVGSPLAHQVDRSHGICAACKERFLATLPPDTASLSPPPRPQRAVALAR